MADQSDVETLLVSMVAAALYPNGPSGASAVGPSAASTAAGRHRPRSMPISRRDG